VFPYPGGTPGGAQNMLILMRSDASPEHVRAVMERVRARGFEPVELPGADRVAIGVLGTSPAAVLRDLILSLPGVQDAVPVSKPFKLVGREWKPTSSQVVVAPDLGGGVTFGLDAFLVIAGPCAVESELQIMETAAVVRSAGGHLLRGGAYKPRTSPYTFRGMAEEGLRLLRQAREETGLPIVTEVLNVQDVETVAAYADMLQVGARNMQNYSLLEEVGRTGRPILLKRGMSATVEEWLLSAEYIVNQGNPNVVLCERGIRTFETYTRNTLDLSAIPAVKELSHLPVIADPSHGTGRWTLIPAMAAATLAAGADGLMVEVHPDPAQAQSDGAQSLRPDRFTDMMGALRKVAPGFGRKL
ncbi:MAG: 3-deoxy-7-phosphoheptulonate synthase, partial [Candidatus Dormibacteria bacterium]